MIARWRLDTPALNGYEDIGYGDDSSEGVLSCSYSDNTDSRWRGELRLGPLVTTIDCDGADAAGGGSVGTPATVNAFAFSNGINAIDQLVVGRGTKLAAIKLSDRTQVMNGTMAGAGAPFAEAVTDLIYTKSGAGTQEMSVGFDDTIYQVITALPATGGFTASANNESIKNRVFGAMDSDDKERRIIGAGRVAAGQNTVRQNVIASPVTMDASSWTTIITIGGEAVIFTGVALDGRFLLVGTSNGIYYCDIGGNYYRPLIDSIDNQLSAPTNCFPGETTVVLHGEPKAISRRWYDGVVFDVETSSGKKLTATPNHPVLTGRGWRGLGLLKKGDYVVSSKGADGIFDGNPHVENVPTTLAQLFDAAADARQTERVVMTPVDFHGDGSDGEIDVIPLDRELWHRIQATLTQPVREQVFAGANVGLGSEFPDRASMQLQVATGAPPSRLVSSHRDRSFGFGRRVRVPQLLGSLKVAGNEASSFHAMLNSKLGEANPASNFSETEAAQVEFDQVVSVRRRSFHGFVYNLETDSGRYYANTIVVHNCYGMWTWDILGPATLVPLGRSLRIVKALQSVSVGPEVFRTNTSPVQGRVGKGDGSELWAYLPIYNTITGETYICAVRPRQPDDPHGNLLSYYPIVTLTDTESKIVAYAGTRGSQANGTVYFGSGTDVAWFLEGRTNRFPDDTSYAYAASGTFYGTELRRYPERRKKIVRVGFETKGCTSTETVTVSIVYRDHMNAAQTVALPKRISNGWNWLPMPSGGIEARAFYPTIALARGGTTTSSPVILGDLVVDWEFAE